MRCALVGAGGDDDRGDDAGGDGGEDVVAVDFAPLVATGRLAEMVGVPVDLGAALPVVMADFGALVPFAVTDVVSLLVVVRVVLRGEGEAAGEGEGEGGNGDDATGNFHGGPRGDGVSDVGVLLGSTIRADRVALFDAGGFFYGLRSRGIGCGIMVAQAGWR